MLKHLVSTAACIGERIAAPQHAPGGEVASGARAGRGYARHCNGGDTAVPGEPFPSARVSRNWLEALRLIVEALSGVGWKGPQRSAGPTPCCGKGEERAVESVLLSLPTGCRASSAVMLSPSSADD